MYPHTKPARAAVGGRAPRSGGAGACRCRSMRVFWGAEVPVWHTCLCTARPSATDSCSDAETDASHTGRCSTGRRTVRRLQGPWGRRVCLRLDPSERGSPRPPEGLWTRRNGPELRPESTSSRHGSVRAGGGGGGAKRLLLTCASWRCFVAVAAERRGQTCRCWAPSDAGGRSAVRADAFPGSPRPPLPAAPFPHATHAAWGSFWLE